MEITHLSQLHSLMNGNKFQKEIQLADAGSRLKRCFHHKN